ncbi:holo-ACP synthase [Acidobacteriota bacterium]
MILGIGVDVIHISRMERIHKRWGRRFIDRAYTNHEIAYCEDRKNPIPHYTVRFAAKEAVFKALSRLKGQGLSLKDIEVHRSDSGRPEIKLHGAACETAQILGVKRILVSLTHSTDIAAAQVVLEGENGAGNKRPC